MLKIGVIGYGGRVAAMIDAMTIFDVPFRVAAIVDPRAKDLAKLLKGGPDKGVFRAPVNEAVTKGAVVYDSADEMLEKAVLDGVMIGTRCHLHTDMACKVAKKNIPLFLEKPVAISFEQVKKLDAAFKKVTAPTVISFPLRLTPMVQKVRQIIDSGQLGPLQHVVAVNDVPYGHGYFGSWYRNYDQVGGLFLQKATHDFDYIFYLLNDVPKQICAMKSQRIYGQKDKPFDLLCKDCDEQDECMESPFNRFYRRFQSEKLDRNTWQQCLFSKDIKNEDSGNAIIEMKSGVQVSYTQNFFVRNQRVARRGARLYGYKGTVDFDWYRNTIIVYDHIMPEVETIEFTGQMPHFGGDRELIYDFLMAMKEGRQSRSPISAGILSALSCLWARESAETKKYCEIKMPK